MRFSGQTPLDQVGIGAEQRRLLRSLWIESIEEAVAIVAATGGGNDTVDDGGLRALVSSPKALQAVSPQRRSQIQSARQGGGLGCLVEPQILDDFRRMGRLRPNRAAPSGAYEAKLPGAVRLMDRMPPVRDQGQRGTCVAFGSVALREFLLGDHDELSEQFLYWACKEFDGHPGPGTYIHTAMTALARYGVCEERIWPYNPHQASDEGQGPASAEARKAALRYRLPSTRTVEPNVVADYKHMLAGDDDQCGMPVTFGTLVFNSWYMSPETHRTGKITLPLPGETPAGGHAWCVVGYVDDDGVPGGGYFIIRNSWGKGWAGDSPEAPGHAMMPYEYVERYAMEAFTGPLQVASHQPQRPVTTFDQCVGVLDRDAREELDGQPGDGRLLKAGVRVLADRFAKDVFREATPANEQRFRQRDLTWTDESWRHVWFLDPTEFPKETAGLIDSSRAARERFMGAIHQNLMTSPGHAFPWLRPPWWLALVPFDWQPKIRNVELIADLTEAVTRKLRERSAGPPALEWPERWNQLLKGLNAVSVYAVRRHRATVHVVSAFITPLRVNKSAAPAVAPLDQTVIDAVVEAYEWWGGQRSSPPTQVAFMTFGAVDCPAADPAVTLPDRGDRWYVVSQTSGDRPWASNVPKRFGDCLAIRDFADRLRPQTGPQQKAIIRDCVEELITEGGNVTVERVSKRSGYRHSVVGKAFLVLQDRAGIVYRLYRTVDGQLAIRHARSGEAISITTASYHGSFIYRHGFRLAGAAVAYAGWWLRSALGLSGWLGVLAGIMAIYVASCVQSEINRRADEKGK
ncbi:MAG: C1 family peptidase [Phycisphaeraceae bacterium]|nr:C1 family peptidase [Phycisphaeraceae bacterium]